MNSTSHHFVFSLPLLRYSAQELGMKTSHFSSLDLSMENVFFAFEELNILLYQLEDIFLSHGKWLLALFFCNRDVPPI